MNKKLIIAAVSAAVAVPVVSFADTTAYGRARGIVVSSESKTDVQSDIRFGLKASGDIGNGLTTHAKVEMTINPDSDTNRVVDKDGKVNPGGGYVSGTTDVRVAQAGLSGPFGNVQIGQMWSAYFNHFGTMVSISNFGDIGAAFLRKPNTVQYSNSFGPVSLAVDVRANDGKDSGSTSESGLGIGVTLNPIEALTIGIATDTAKDEAADQDDTKHTGIAARYTLGNGMFGTIGIQKSEGGDRATEPGTDFADGANEVENQYLWVGGPITSNTSWLLGTYSSETTNTKAALTGPTRAAGTATQESKGTTWNIKHSIGGGLGIFYEGQKWEKAGKKSISRNTVGMVFNF